MPARKEFDTTDVQNDTPETDLTTTETAKTETARDSRPEDRPEDDETPMIVHRETYINDRGVQDVREHGPMPLADWPAYAKKNGF